MTTDEKENKQVFEQKAGLDKNIMVPILVVTILTVLAVWLVPSGEEEVDLTDPLPQLDSVIKPLDEDGSELPSLDTGSEDLTSDDTETDNSESFAISGDTPESPDQVDDATSDAEGDVRALISELRKGGPGSSQKAYAEAEKLRGIGDNENAYLLYFFAARNGHSDAALALGEMADPAYFSSVSSALTSPDPAQAVKWYKMAIDAGSSDAKKRLADLTRRIKKQAENGSSEAQRLLLQLR